MKFLRPNVQRIGWVILYSLMSFITFFTCYQFVDDVERFLYPVVSEFKVGEVMRQGNLLTLHGSLNKHRDCQTIALNAYAQKPNQLPQLADLNIAQDGGSEKIITRALGEQKWGPWYVTAPEGPFKLSFFVRHRCNPIYDVTTALTTVDIQ